jgi:hypothetical protein
VVARGRPRRTSVQEDSVDDRRPAQAQSVRAISPGQPKAVSGAGVGDPGVREFHDCAGWAGGPPMVLVAGWRQEAGVTGKVPRSASGGRR